MCGFLKELALCTLMKFVELEAKYPLVKAEWKGSLTFPRELLKVSGKAQQFSLWVPPVPTFPRAAVPSKQVLGWRWLV